MRLIKAKARKAAGNIYCDHCKPEKVDAIWRGKRCDHQAGDYACEGHKHLIVDDFEPEDDGHMTEADYQTWGRL